MDETTLDEIEGDEATGGTMPGGATPGTERIDSGEAHPRRSGEQPSRRPWVARYEPGVPREVAAAGAPFHALMTGAAAAAPGLPALWTRNRRVSYAEVDAAVARAAGALAKAGVGPGVPVLLASPPGLSWVAVALATLRVGGELVPADASLAPESLCSLASAIRPAVAFAGPAGVAALARSELGGTAAIVEIRGRDESTTLLRALSLVFAPRRSLATTPTGVVSWPRWVAAGGDVVAEEADDGAAAVRMVDPGGDELARFGHPELTAGAQQLAAWLTDVLPGSEVILQLTSPASSFGFASSLGTSALLRAELVLLRTTPEGDAVDALRYLRPTVVLADAASLDRMVGDARLVGSIVRSLRAVLVVDPAPVDLLEQFADVTGLSPCQGLSLPFVAGLVACNPVNGARVEGSLGLPLPGIDIRPAVRGDRGADPPTGTDTSDPREAAETLLVRGPNVAPAGAWRGAGGDLRMNEGGYLFIEGGRSGAGAKRNRRGSGIRG